LIRFSCDLRQDSLRIATLISPGSRKLAGSAVASAALNIRWTRSS